MDGQPSERAELVFSIIDIPETPSLQTNSMFGAQALSDRSLITSNYLWGLSWQRGLSPGGFIEWDEVEGTEDVYTWDKFDEKLGMSTNVAIVCPTFRAKGEVQTPAWLWPNTQYEDPASWSNWVYDVVDRYKDRIKYWEDINEPSGAWTPAEYAVILKHTAGAIKAADPTAFFIAFGGLAEGTGTSWGKDVWDLLDATTKSQIDAVSIHEYPTDTDYGDLLGGGAFGIYCDNKPVWNTETGLWSWGDYRGTRVGGKQGGITYLDHWGEHQYRRMPLAHPAAGARNWLGSFREGITKYFYYDGRVSSYRMTKESTNPSWFNYTDDAINSIGAAYLWSKHFCDLATAQIKSSNIVEDAFAVGFERAGSDSLAVWSFGYTNYQATVSNSAFAVYDLMGNPLATNKTVVSFSGIPSFWVSDTLTGTQLAEMFSHATIAVANDITAPAVSLDLTAHGSQDERHYPLKFRWTAIDDTDSNTDDFPEMVLTRYRFVNITNEWTDWSANRTAILESSVLTGTANMAYIEIQAKDSSGNISSAIQGPMFDIEHSDLDELRPNPPANFWYFIRNIF